MILLLNTCFAEITIPQIAPNTQSARETPSENKPEPVPQSVMATPSLATGKNNLFPLIELKAGYFFFSDSKMRKIFNAGGLDVQLSTSYPVWKWLQIYGSVEYLQRHGKTKATHRKTTIWEVPVSLGLKPTFVICPEVHYYFAVGPRYFFVHQHNHSPYLDRIVTQNTVGFFINTGFTFFPLRHFSINTFGEYSFNRWHFDADKTNVYGESAQLGGFTFGLGLGYYF